MIGCFSQVRCTTLGQVHFNCFMMGASLRPKGAAFPRDKPVRVGDGSFGGRRFVQQSGIGARGALVRRASARSSGEPGATQSPSVGLPKFPAEIAAYNSTRAQVA